MGMNLTGVKQKVLKNEAGWGKACGSMINLISDLEETVIPVCQSWTDVYINSCNSWDLYSTNNSLCQVSGQDVTLTVNKITEATQMKIINVDPAVYCDSLTGSESGWQTKPYTQTLNWTLLSGSGPKKVCVMLGNSAGWGKACGAVITLERDDDCVPITSATINELTAWYSVYRSGSMDSSVDFNCDDRVDMADLVSWYGVYRR